MGAENLFETSLHDAEKKSRDDFTLTYPGLYLRGLVPETDEDGDPDFFTGLISGSSLKRMIAEAQELQREGAKSEKPVIHPGHFVVEIRKHEINSWSRWVSLGRAENNDIAFLHSSVSKLHARFHREDDSPGPTPYMITDMGSKMGTSVNGRMLAPSSAVAIGPGDVLRFGEIDCRVLDGAGLFENLVR